MLGWIAFSRKSLNEKGSGAPGGIRTRNIGIIVFSSIQLRCQEFRIVLIK
jgi:hypothetical protein